jgi:hypothetical protein
MMIKPCIKYRMLAVACLLVANLATSGCSKTKNLSNQLPMKQAIGKKFITQQDLVLFEQDAFGKSITGDRVYLGIAGKSPSLFHISGTNAEQYIGRKIDGTSVIGVVKKGSIITISKIMQRATIETSSVSYSAYIFSIPEYTNYSCDITCSMDSKSIENSPPYKNTWAEPPLFSPDVALPLLSEGIWWQKQ